MTCLAMFHCTMYVTTKFFQSQIAFVRPNIGTLQLIHLNPHVGAVSNLSIRSTFSTSIFRLLKINKVSFGNCLKKRFSSQSEVLGLQTKMENGDLLGDLSIVEEQGTNKRLSVERIYQKKSQLEHILLRPDTYIGSVEPVTQSMWVWDEGKGMVNRDITFVPGLYKIFDEIVVNAADNKQRDPAMTAIKIDIDCEKNVISVWNDGKGIPVIQHKVEKLYVPEMIFGHLLTSSNYNDEDKKVTGGRNGYGAKLCNIFSLKFTVETSCKDYKKKFRQSWSKNMSVAHDHHIASASTKDYTKITFQPDLAKFHMTELDKDIVALLSRRAYDLAGSCAGVKVYLNGERLPVKNFQDYVKLYTSSVQDENGEALKVVNEKVNDRWEVCLAASDKGFQQISFVNSIATTKGGRHVDYVMDQVSKKLSEVIKKKNKGGVDVKGHQIKNYCWLFINCLIENPTFDSQTKENMTLVWKKFGSTCTLPEKFLKMVTKSGVVENIMNWVKFKAQSQLNKKSAGKSSKLKGIPKLDDANNAGTKHSLDCTLILTEGDSAKTLAISGLSVVGRDNYGVFPLRGKMLNVRDASHKQIMANAEISSLVKIMGFKYNKKYESEDDVKSLRYGKIMIMTDQDHDGSHIKGLLINFIHQNWPEMLRQRVLEEFITPIVKATKGSQILSFYTLPEFDEWRNSTDNAKSWKIKYYKGLGTSTSKEAQSYFADMTRHRVRFKYSGPDDDGCIDMAFSKTRADDRKVWLNNYMEERRRCQEDQRPDPGSELYTVERRVLSYKDFINKELVMFSCADLERSVPSLVDGLKPGQRKVLYTCFRRNDKREVKVAQLSGSVAELSAYHHGEVSLQSTIVNMAQNYVGSNNLNLLQPIGQFGTRLYGGKDSASSRYIFTMLSPLARLIFPPVDDNVLTFLYDDNQRVEPRWYCPVIPMVLVNGSDGIGTGWATRIPNHDIRQLVDNCKRLMDGEEPLPMSPSYKNFKGTIEKVDQNKYAVSGEIAYLDENTLEITELPVKTWTQPYKESVLESLLGGGEKSLPQSILEYKEYNTDTTVKFIIKMSANKMKEAEAKGLHKFFSLQTSISCNNLLVLFDQYGCLRKFNSTTEILKEFYPLRLKLYGDRKDFLTGMLTAEALRLSNQARFILEKIGGKISIDNKAKKVLIKLLQDKKYDSDPVKAWKESIQKKQLAGEESSQDEDEDDASSEDTKGPDYNYILNMPLWSLTKERKEDLLKQRDAKQTELVEIKKRTPIDLWRTDLDKLVQELDKIEKKEREEALTVPEPKKKTVFGKARGKAKTGNIAEYLPSAQAIRVEPKVDPSLLPKPVGEKKARVKKEKVENPITEVKTEPDTDANSMDADEPPSLFNRIKNSATKTKPPSKISAAGAKRKALKKNPWESGSESDASIDDFVSNDSSAAEILPEKREKRSARAVTNKKKYNFDSDSEGFSSSDEEETAKEKKKVSKKTEEKTVEISSDSEPCHDWDQVMSDSPEKSKTKTQSKKTVPEKRKQVDKVFDVSSETSDDPPKKVARIFLKKTDLEKTKTDLKTAKSAKKMLATSTSDDNDDVIALSDSDEPKKNFPKSKPKKQVVKKPAPSKAKKAFSDSDDDISDLLKSSVIKKTKVTKPQKSIVQTSKAKPKKAKADSPGDMSDADDDVVVTSGAKKTKSKAVKAIKSTAQAKKRKKKNAWSSDDGGDDNSDDSFASPVAPRAATSRRQNKPVKYKFSDDDDDDSDF